MQLEMSGTSSDMAVLLATNRLQVIGGALSAGFFNSLSKGLPIGLLMARATSPYFHYLMIRPDLKAKLREPSDLKGRTVAVAARGAILVYELAKILEAGGLSLGDVESEIHSLRSDGDRAHHRRGRRRPDDLAVAGSGRSQGHRDQMDQRRQQDQGAAGPGIGVADEHGLDAAERGRGEEIRAGDVARRARLLQCLPSRSEPGRDHPHPGEVFRRQGPRADQSDRMGRDRRAWAHLRGERQRHPGHVLKEKLVADRVPIGRIAPVGWVGEVAAQLGPFQLVHDDGTPGCR